MLSSSKSNNKLQIRPPFRCQKYFTAARSAHPLSPRIAALQGRLEGR